MKRIALFLLCFCLFPTLVRADQAPRYARLHILYTNDLWGKLYPFNWRDEAEVGGVERRAALVRQIRAESKDPVLLLDAGDIYMSGPLEDLKGEPDIAAMNAMGYDAAAVGDWDFAYQSKSESGFTPYSGARKAAYPLLCANLLWSTTQKPVLSPWTILSAGKLRVAVFGLMFGGAKWDGMETADPIQTARKLAPKLKSQADVVVAITHIGYTKEEELAKAVPEIDVIVGGGSVHEPDRLEAPVIISSSNETHPFWIGGPVIVQDGRFGVTLGQLTLNLRKSDQSFHIMSCSVQLHKVDKTIAPAADLTAILKRASAPFNQPIGKCSRDMTTRSQRGDELEVWIAEVMRRIVHADIGTHAYDADINLHKGTITSFDIRRMLPRQTKLTRVVMTPAQFQQAIAGKSISISGTPPAGAGVIKVAADEYFATHLTAVGGVIDMDGKPVNAELQDYIKSKKIVGDEVFPEPGK